MKICTDDLREFYGSGKVSCKQFIGGDRKALLSVKDAAKICPTCDCKRQGKCLKSREIN